MRAFFDASREQARLATAISAKAPGHWRGHWAVYQALEPMLDVELPFGGRGRRGGPGRGRHGPLQGGLEPAKALQPVLRLTGPGLYLPAWFALVGLEDPNEALEAGDALTEAFPSGPSRRCSAPSSRWPPTTSRRSARRPSRPAGARRRRSR